MDKFPVILCCFSYLVEVLGVYFHLGERCSFGEKLVDEDSIRPEIDQFVVS